MNALFIFFLENFIEQLRLKYYWTKRGVLLNKD